MWFSTPLLEVLDWPQWLVETYRQFFAREPHPDEQSRYLLGLLATRVGNFTSKQQTQLSDVLTHLTAWEPVEERPADPDATPVSMFGR